jgi:hypothetical protein
MLAHQFSSAVVPAIVYNSIEREKKMKERVFNVMERSIYVQGQAGQTSQG